MVEVWKVNSYPYEFKKEEYQNFKDNIYKYCSLEDIDVYNDLTKSKLYLVKNNEIIGHFFISGFDFTNYIIIKDVYVVYEERSKGFATQFYDYLLNEKKHILSNPSLLTTSSLRIWEKFNSANCKLKGQNAFYEDPNVNEITYLDDLKINSGKIYRKGQEVTFNNLRYYRLYLFNENIV